LIADTLVIIPARGGSKGLPGKNIKCLAGKPLIQYSIETARQLTTDDHICVSTDSDDIRTIAEKTGLRVPFLRPEHLASDTAGTYEVLLHALDHYKQRGVFYNRVILLQPTSPFRNVIDLRKMIEIMDSEKGIEMVVSVGVSHHNPYFSLFEENAEGHLVKSKKGNFATRQDCPPAYYYNGSAYLINTEALKRRSLANFERIKKYVMEEKYCLDIDTPLDWLICEALLERGIYRNANN
jgi:N-acylneuraminate cytidylyltransferase